MPLSLFFHIVSVILCAIKTISKVAFLKQCSAIVLAFIFSSHQYLVSFDAGTSLILPEDVSKMIPGKH